MADRGLVLSVILVLASAPAVANEFEVRDGEIVAGGVLAVGTQCDDDGCHGAVPLQTEVSLQLNGRHEVFVKLGIASGDGRNSRAPFNLSPWAADLQSDVENVNGDSRSHLLAAWYRHTADLGGAGSLESTFGLIDSTDFLDDNVYANDEYTQFMNEALVNGPNAFLPSYDTGFALGWTGDNWSMRGAYMKVAENDDGNSFDFAGVQLGYRADTPLGEGNYRLLVDATDDRFFDPTGTTLERRAAFTISCDQALGRMLGAFVRVGRQSDDAGIDYANLYSGGIDLAGEAWGRENDNIGIGYAYLNGGNGELLHSRVMESYYRFAVNEMFAVAGDVQYLIDRRAADESPDNFVFGLRLTAEF